jgi:hypothetical protein
MPEGISNMAITNKRLAIACAVALGFAAACGSAAIAADDTKPAATTTAPDAKATTTPAPTTTTPAPTKTTTPEAKKSTTPSPCKGLDNAACTANTLCTWYKEAKLKDGHTRKAHCQKKPTHAPKKKTTTTPPT